MKHHIPSSFFTENRKRLSALLTEGSVAILNSNDLLPTNADGTFRFKQNNDLYYLTGITQENTMLMLFPSHPDPYYREIIFVEEPNELRTKWDGRRLGKDEVSAVSGIPHVRYEHEFEKVFNSCVYAAAYIYLNATEHSRASLKIQTRDNRFAQWCKAHYTLHHYKRLAPLMMQLRTIKHPVEIGLLKEAAAITEKGFRRVLKFLRPGVTQKQVEAEMIHEYLFNGAEWADYTPIVSSGSDTCILHCSSNENICKDGELALIDAAASWRAYNSDLTRTIPVNGKYTVRQKEVYNAVLRVHKSMRQEMLAGK
jgi:Xaa-Pro aminopeptidase